MPLEHLQNIPGQNANPSFIQDQRKGFIVESEEQRLLTDASRPAIEKLQLFTKMIRRNAMFNQFTVKRQNL